MATNKYNGNGGCRNESSSPPRPPPSATTTAAEADVQLGFAIHVNDSTRPVLGHRSHEWWEDWDGGKIGGRPSWLNPRDLPSGPVRCDDCASASAFASGDGGEGDMTGGDRGGASADGPLMRFVAQLYCPADDEDDEDDEGDDGDDGGDGDDGAFHRSLYVFACPSARHSRCDGEQGGGGVGSNRAGVKVLRCQMARRNPFYPFEEGDDDDDKGRPGGWDRHRPEFWGVKLCAVCGQRARHSASAEGGGDDDDASPSFCSREHREEYRRHANRDRTNGDEDYEGEPNLPSVLREMEMVVEEEPGEDDASTPSPPAQAGGGGGTSREESIRLRQQLEQLRLLAGAAEVSGDDDDEDATLEQEDLNRLAGVPEGMGTTEIEKVTATFLDRIRRERSQCLRYDRGGQPLWVSGRCVPDGDRGSRIPDCPYCGSERRFEFQVMPQMLHYLEVNGGLREPTSVEAGMAGWGEEEDDMDWGTIAVYTCAKSCGGGVGDFEGTEEESGTGGAYKEEFAWRQPPLS